MCIIQLNDAQCVRELAAEFKIVYVPPARPS
jgi:hypothetical protein